MTAQVRLPARPSLGTASYEPHIDGLRAVAVIAVVVFHAFPSLLPGGYVGVDVFFVISGYLITRIILRDLQRQSFSVREFYGRRVRRIFPALALVLATGLLFGWAVLLPSEWESLGQQAAGGAFFLSNFSFMSGSGYFDPPSEANPFLHLWSLAIEEQFYLAWPFLLIIAHRLRSKGLWILTTVAVVSFIGFCLMEDRDRAFYCTGTRVWQLAIGGIIAWSQSLPKQSANGLPASFKLCLELVQPHLPVVGLLLIAVSATLLSSSPRYPGAAAAMPTLGAALVILGGATSNANRRLFAAPLVVAIGLISYPLYLWHWPLLAYAKILDPETSTVVVRLTLMSAALALSIATYRLLELPIRRLGAVSSVCLVYAIGVLGVTGYYSQLGRLAPYASHQPEMVTVADAQRDWDFPPPSLAPARFNESTFYGTVGARAQVVFIGDSNIEQYATRLEAILEPDRGVAKAVLFATSGGCVPIRGVADDSHPECEAFLRDALSAASSGEVSTVVIGASWHSYFANKHAYHLKRADGSRQRIGAGGTGANDALASLAEMIRELRSSGKEVFLVLNMPVGSEFDPALGVRRPFIGQFLPAPKTSKSRSEVEQMLRVVNEPLSNVAELAGAKVIDPVAFLCSKESCSQFDAAGLPRYKDATHLRASYVRREVKFLDPNLLADDRK